MTPASGRWVSVEAERLEGWLTRFTERHGVTTWTATDMAVTVAAADGAVAECRVPLPPLVAEPGTAYGGIVAHSLTDRRVGVLLVRLGGFAVGVFEGTRLVESKVGSRQVHGRSSAGGWSQQRFARRREGQVKVALAAAADLAATKLVPAARSLDAVVLGGDRQSVESVLADPRLAALRPLVAEPLLDVPDPRLKVLQGTPALFRAVRILITEPHEGPGPHSSSTH